MVQLELDPGLQLELGSRFQDGERAKKNTRGKCEVVEVLASDHKEADTRILLHARHATSENDSCSPVTIH